MSVTPMRIEPLNEINSWNKFKKRFKIAGITVDFCKGVSQTKGAAMLSVIGEVFEILCNFRIDVANINYAMLVSRFNQPINWRENKIILRDSFLSMAQVGKETLKEFTTRVTRAFKHCQLGELQDDMAVHVIIKGIKDEHLRMGLLHITEVNMTIFAVACALYKLANRTLEARDAEVLAVARDRPKKFGQEVCTVCRNTGHNWRPCDRTECYNCLQRGHIASECCHPNRCNMCKKEWHRGAECPSSRGRGQGKSSRGRGQSRGRGRDTYYNITTASSYWYEKKMNKWQHTQTSQAMSHCDLQDSKAREQERNLW